MKGKLKYFVAAFIIMDLLFVGQWAYNKYFLTPESTVDFIDYTLNEEEYFPDSFFASAVRQFNRRSYSAGCIKQTDRIDEREQEF